MLYRLHSKRLSKVITFARKYKEGCRRAIQIFLSDARATTNENLPTYILNRCYVIALAK